MPATPTDALLDVNVLIAAVFADHASHAKARSFVAKLKHYYTTPTTQGGFLRFATRQWKDAAQRQFPPRLTMTRAMTVLRDLTDVTGHIFMADDSSYVELSMRSMRGHRQWTDAYLLHLARQHNVVLATFDAGISTFDPQKSYFFLVS